MIADNILLFLEAQKEANENKSAADPTKRKYDLTEINQLDLRSGICNGLTLLFIESKRISQKASASSTSEDDLAWFLAMQDKIKKFFPASYEPDRNPALPAPTEAELKEMERFVGNLLFLQAPHLVGAPISQSDIPFLLDNLSETVYQIEASIYLNVSDYMQKVKEGVKILGLPLAESIIPAIEVALSKADQLTNSIKDLKPGNYALRFYLTHATALTVNETDPKFSYFDPQLGEINETNDPTLVARMLLYSNYLLGEGNDAPGTAPVIGLYKIAPSLEHKASIKQGASPTQVPFFSEKHAITVIGEDAAMSGPLLSMATQNNDMILTDTILKKRSVNEADHVNRFGNTPLHIAITALNNGMVANFLQREDIEVNVVNNQGTPPLHTAIMVNNVPVVQMLLQKKETELEKTDDKGFTPLNIAATFGRLEVVKELLKKSLDVNKPENHGMTPLYTASLRGHTEVVRLLINDPRVDVNKPEEVNGFSPLQAAIIKDNHSGINLLLKHSDIDVNQKNHKGQTALFTAINSGKEETVRKLLAHCETEINTIDTTERRETPLHAAVREGNSGIVEALLMHSPNIKIINLQDAEGATPLVVAIKDGTDSSVVYDLLMHDDIDINLPTHNGKTPLHWAFEANRGEGIIKSLLMGTNCDVNAADENGITPLMLAVQNGNYSICKMIVENDPDIFAGDYQGGRTALTHAIEDDSKLEIVELLVSHAIENGIAKNNLSEMYSRLRDEFAKAKNPELWQKQACDIFIDRVNKQDSLSAGEKIHLLQTAKESPLFNTVLKPAQSLLQSAVSSAVSWFWSAPPPPINVPQEKLERAITAQQQLVDAKPKKAAP